MISATKPPGIIRRKIEHCSTKNSEKYMEGKSKDFFEVVAISHADNDHTQGVGSFFHLDYAVAYQGKGRFKINELWVPAAIVVEEGLSNDALLIQKEARHRLREGYGVIVFSRPQRLHDWFEKNNLKLEDRAHLIKDAGQLAPGLSLDGDGVEFFVHSPFAHRQDETTVVDRNEDCLVMQATFSASGNAHPVC